MSLKFSSVRHGPLAAERRLLRVLYTEMYLAWQERPDPTELTRGEWKKRLYARVALVCHFYENLNIKVIPLIAYRAIWELGRACGDVAQFDPENLEEINDGHPLLQVPPPTAFQEQGNYQYDQDGAMQIWWRDLGEFTDLDRPS